MPKQKRRRGRPKADSTIKRLDIVKSSNNSYYKSTGYKTEATKPVSESKRLKEESRKSGKSATEVHIGILPASPLDGFRGSKASANAQLPDLNPTVEIKDFVMVPGHTKNNIQASKPANTQVYLSV